ncbi:MAG: peptidase M19 [bacterium]|nr:peptidase M19 [bacterium]
MSDPTPEAVHAASFVIDGTNPSAFDRDVFEALIRGGVTTVNATVAVMEGFRDTMVCLLEWRDLIDANEDLVMPVLSAGDVRTAKQIGKLGIIYGLQNTAALEDHVELLCPLRDAGVRLLQLTYNERNLVGDGVFERVDAGLTQFGLNVVHRMNELGLLIDLSHVGPQTTMDAIEASEQPVAITHAGVKALHDHPRNKTDDQIRAVAAKGGVFGATFWPVFLKNGYASTLSDYVDTIDYAVQLVGPEHVSVASDFLLNHPKEFLQRLRAGRSRDWRAVELDWPVTMPKGIATPEEFPNITTELLKRGYSPDDVGAIMGGSFLQLCETVWR